ncbi:MAG: hypothetical protein AB7H93_25485 [Vicinamibacterales bacterium]|jgi:hypothetical protein
MASALARRCAGLSLIGASVGALAFAAPPAIAASNDIAHVCSKGSSKQRLISFAGPNAGCATGVPVMKAWTKAGKPKLFRSYVCGEVKRTKVGFHADKRWFATWQCVQAGRTTYTIWTRY